MPKPRRCQAEKGGNGALSRLTTRARAWYTTRMKEKKTQSASPVPEAFLARMRRLLDADDFSAYLAALDEPPKRIARKNPLKNAPDDLIRAELGGFPLLPPAAKPGAGALHAAGAYYVQEPAAAAVANLIAPLLPPNARVLDMCAAPGGKVTAAASARADCLFVANEIAFPRAKILLSNVERLGLRNVTVTSLRPDDVACRGVPFDAVIADVPCSGEGMLRKASFFEGDLSDESVAACAQRAARILDACDDCLKAGGILFFSTCTFNRAENEEQVLRLMREKGYEPIALPRPPHARAGLGVDEAIRFFPQDGGGEGHFFCALRKTETAQNTVPARRQKESVSRLAAPLLRRTLAALSQITDEPFPAAQIVTAGEGCELLADDYPFAAFPALRRGMRLCDFAHDRILPHHHFATAADGAHLLYSPSYVPNSEQIAAYLHGNAFPCDAKDGFRVLCVASLPLGLIKVTDGMAKNHYPKGLRI